MLLLAAGGLLAMSGFPWLLEAFLISAFFLRSPSMHVCVQISPFYKDTGHIPILPS